MKKSLQFAALMGAGAVAYSLVEPRFLRVRKQAIRLPNLPESARGMRVVQLSDLHCGLYTPFSTIEKAIQKTRDLNPDLVVLTGDMVARRDSYFPRFVRKLAPTIDFFADQLAGALLELQPRLGILAVSGNHDLWNGDFGPVSTSLAKAGVRCLVNESVEIGGLKVVGVDDLRAGKPDFHRAFAGLSADSPQLILAHNPRYAALLKGRNALILSGHTHGGQVKTPIRPIKAPVDAAGIFWEHGLFRIGRAQLYVSSGIGQVGFPVRLGVVPEIVMFELI